MRILVVGNGESRSGVAIPAAHYEYVIGCNALYREYEPDFLVSVDSSMLQEISKNYAGPVLYRPHPGFVQPRSNWFTKKYIHDNNSGVAAIYLALELGAVHIDLLGFDLGHSNEVNNIYAGTDHYNYENNYSYGKWETKLQKLGKTNSIRRIIDDKCKKGVMEWEEPLSVVKKEWGFE